MTKNTEVEVVIGASAEDDSVDGVPEVSPSSVVVEDSDDSIVDGIRAVVEVSSFDESASSAAADVL